MSNPICLGPVACPQPVDAIAALTQPFPFERNEQPGVPPAPVDRLDAPAIVRTPVASPVSAPVSALSAPRACARISVGRNFAVGVIRSVTPEIRAALGFDPASRAEMLAMQRTMGWPQTGRMDGETSRRLNGQVRAYQVALVDAGARGFGHIDGIVGPLMARQLASANTNLLAWMSACRSHAPQSMR